MSRDIEKSLEGLPRDEMEAEILKVAITMPDLYQTLREIFYQHPDPAQLDDTGKILVEIFNNLENARDG